ncbi:MAG: hypothetical protein QF553_03050 [Alphaproteobacteria bacterium]|nr:hypothetical protein [Alphaproteobacteria bacterium]
MMAQIGQSGGHLLRVYTGEAGATEHQGDVMGLGVAGKAAPQALHNRLTAIARIHAGSP